MSATQGIDLFTLICRLTWMLLGPCALLFSAVAIVRIGQGWLTAADIAFFIVVLAMLAGRTLEFGTGHAQTADGAPATRQHLVRYLLLTPAAALGAWVVLNLLANHWLS